MNYLVLGLQDGLGCPKLRSIKGICWVGVKLSNRDSVTVSEQASLPVLFARLAGIGWFVAVSVAGCTITGWWLDSNFNIKPALTLVGLAVGLSVAVKGVFQILKSFGLSLKDEA